MSTNTKMSEKFAISHKNSIVPRGKMRTVKG